MLRFAVDENLNHNIVRGLRRRRVEIDIVGIREADLGGADDPTVLEWAAREGRILITHDANTMVRHATDRIQVGNRMPGLIVIAQSVSVGLAIEDLLRLDDGCIPDGEWEGRIQYLPLQ